MGVNPDDGPDFASVYIDDVLVFSETLEEPLSPSHRSAQRVRSETQAL